MKKTDEVAKKTRARKKNDYDGWLKYSTAVVKIEGR